jgi:hypothetical protein
MAPEIGTHGSYSNGRIEIFDQGSMIKKTYEPYEFDPQRLISLMDRFTTIATEIGIDVPKSTTSLVEKDGHTFVQVEEPYLGKSLDKTLRDFDEPNTRNALRLYLDHFRRAFEHGFPISLDPPLANFCLKGEKLYYIDMMPPRINDGVEHICEIPEIEDETIAEQVKSRYFGPHLPIVVYSQILRAHPNVDYTEIRRMIVDTFSLPEDFFETALDLSGTPQDADILRCIIGELSYKNENARSMQQRVFELTHIGDGGIFPEQNAIDEGLRVIQECLE